MEKIYLLVSKSELDLYEKAADRSGDSINSFILDSAAIMANKVLMDDMSLYNTDFIDKKYWGNQ